MVKISNSLRAHKALMRTCTISLRQYSSRIGFQMPSSSNAVANDGDSACHILRNETPGPITMTMRQQLKSASTGVRVQIDKSKTDYQRYARILLRQPTRQEGSKML